jgi:hypothetical protein
MRLVLERVYDGSAFQQEGLGSPPDESYSNAVAGPG